MSETGNANHEIHDKLAVFWPVYVGAKRNRRSVFVNHIHVRPMLLNEPSAEVTVVIGRMADGKVILLMRIVLNSFDEAEPTMQRRPRSADRRSQNGPS